MWNVTEKLTCQLHLQRGSVSICFHARSKSRCSSEMVKHCSLVDILCSERSTDLVWTLNIIPHWISSKNWFDVAVNSQNNLYNCLKLAIAYFFFLTGQQERSHHEGHVCFVFSENAKASLKQIGFVVECSSWWSSSLHLKAFIIWLIQEIISWQEDAPHVLMIRH